MADTSTLIYDSDAPHHPFIDPFRNFWNYRSLLRLLITRDLTVRYKRSVLGVWWTILNPLLTTIVMWIVFSQIFRRSGAEVPFIVYLLTGVLMISMFFSQGVVAAGASLVSGRGILSKIRVPGEVFALTAAGAAMVNFFIGLIPLAIVMLVTRTPIPWTWILIPIPALAMLCLVTGMGMLIAAAAVHFFDVLDLVRVIVQLSIWLVPTFYPLEMIPEQLQVVIKANPLYSYLVIFRYFAYGGYPAELWHYAMMFTSAVVLLALGVYVFSRVVAEPGGSAVNDHPRPIEVADVRLAYRLARNRAGTFKEFAINLLKRQLVYEDLWALDGVSFDVGRGEVFGIVGPNGAGKSTLMKALAGVLPPTSGRVVVRGIVSPMIEVSGGISQELTGHENIVLLGTLLGREPSEMRSRTGEIAEWAGLTDFLNVPVHAISSGMRARLAFAVATDVKPDVLLVDEVLSVGDEEFRRKSLGRIEDLMAGGTSVVIVSHSLATVSKYAETAIWLDHGRIKAMGPAKEVVDAYQGSV